jgi:amino acid adenylation domain-containing protein
MATMESPAENEITIFDRELLAERAYWLERLAGRRREPAELRLDYPRGGGRPRRTESLPFAAGDELSGRLARMTGGGPFLLYTTLLAAFEACLFRYSGSPTVVVGSPARREPGDRHQRPNLVAIVDELHGGIPFRELLLAVRQTLLDAYSRQQYPCERLLHDLEAAGDPGRSPFAVLLALPEIHTEVPEVERDLAITWERGPRGLAGRIDFRADLFARPTLERFAAHYLTLLAAAAADPGAAVGDLPLLPDSERFQVLQAWNDTGGGFPHDRALHHLFEARAAAAPEAPAVCSAGVEITYGELDRRANRLAHLLRGLGAGPGRFVGVWMDGCPETVAALLAVLKAGAAYVPVEGAWPRERIRTILAGLRVSCLLTRAAELRAVYEVAARLPELRNVLCLDADGPEPPPEPVDAEAVRALWDHVAESAVDQVTAAGFVSSYTGEPFSPAEVDQYRDRVAGLAAPFLGPGRRVLEIGCGSGLFLAALAPRAGSYVGIDPSPATQARNRAALAGSGNGNGNVELVTGFAHEIDVFPAESFDLVLLASTAQFFPGPMYLKRVLGQALRLLAPGGALLLADLMDARQKEDFARSLEAARSARREGAGGRSEPGDELYVDEALLEEWAAELPGVAAVEAAYRGGEFANELRYRFDVVLQKALPGAPVPPPRPVPRRLLTAWHANALPLTRPPGGAGPEDVAYVIHTSGSTGAPKGVVVRHAAAVQLVDWVNRRFEVGPADRILLVTSLCFDLSVYDIFGLLAAGGSIEVAASPDLRDPARLLDLLYHRPVTFWDSAPALLQQLAPSLTRPPAGGDDRRLRLVFLSGDWIPLSLPEEVRRAFPGAQVVSLGGATEAAVWSNFFPVASRDPLWVSIPYGRPIRNARYYVLDERLSPCPIGVAGDLYIGGLCLAAGYWNEAALTAERFLPDPHGGVPGGRLYRTGDRARSFPDGNLEFLGRLDHQVKIRGHRVELAEVEAALGRHPEVREVVVLARDEPPAGKVLAAYVVPRDGSAPTTGELQRFVRGRLPEPMVPAAFVFLDSLPLTPHGKVDRAGLLSHDGARPRLESTFVAPRTPVEQTLARIWTEVLGRDPIGVDDNFFELGGHSLKGTQVASRVREAFGVELPLRLLFKSPTLAQLARVVEARRRSGEGARPAPPIVPLSRPVPR